MRRPIVTVTVRPVPEFATLIPWLLEGKGDVIASALCCCVASVLELST